MLANNALYIWKAATHVANQYFVNLTTTNPAHPKFLVYLRENNFIVTEKSNMFGQDDWTKYTINLSEYDLVYAKLAYNVQVEIMDW